METAAGYDMNLRKGIVPNAQNYDSTFNQDAATPPASLPVLDKKTAKEAQAENVGFEEFNEEVASKERDFKAVLKSLFMPFLGGTEKREGPLGRIWNKMEKLKIKKSAEYKAEHKNDKDPDEEIE